MHIKEILVGENDARVAGLRQRMDDFYSSICNYSDFAEPNFKPQFWVPVRTAIEHCLQSQTQCRVLEFGAGQTGFATWATELRAQITFDVQDITPTNKDYLLIQADNVFIGDINTVSGIYNVIFFTFTWEHISNPRTVLKHLLALLTPGGVLIIASSRYDFPFYLSPSVRHLALSRRIQIGLWLILRRLRVLLGGNPDFLIHLEPACLHIPWYRDTDAIHWVSLLDIKRALPHGFLLTQLSIGATGLKGRLWEKVALMFVQIEKAF